METNMLIEKVLKAIHSADLITDRYAPGYGNFCGTTKYFITPRLAVERLHNGCETVRVYIDGIEVDTIPRKTAMDAIDLRRDQITKELINSL